MTRSAPRGPRLLVVFGVTVCLVAVVVAVLGLRHDRGTAASSPVPEQAATATATGSPRASATTPGPAGPDPRAGPAVGSESADPDSADPAPVEMVVDRVGLRMPVVAVGVASDGQMALPPEPTKIGWYRFGPGPAARRGSAVLAGHVDSKQYGKGPLVKLRKVRPGDEIRVRVTGDTVLRYRTTDVVSIAKKSLPELGVFDRDGRKLLRVVTCGGAYDRDRGGYQDNVVVTAVPVE